MVIKQLNIKNGTYYFYNDLINLDGFDADLLKLDKKRDYEYECLLHWLCYKETCL